MSENLKKLLGDFVKEADLKSVAIALVDFDGKELTPLILSSFDEDFNSQRAASVFAMVVNFLDKTLGGIHFEEDEVEDIVVTSKNGYFFLKVIKSEECFLGVAVGKDEDISKIRNLIEKYRPMVLEQL